MATGEQVTITLTAKDGASQTFQKVGRSAQDMGKQIDDAGKRAGTVGDRFNQAGARIGLAFSAAQGALTEFARAAAESEASQARLDTAIENTGHVTLEYADALDKASAAAIKLGFDDEDAADSIATLTTATGDAQTAINDLSVAEDIARTRKISLAQATSIVVAAEQGRMGALQRLGIQLDANATREERMDALQAKFAGNAEAYSQTTAGTVDRLQAEFGNLEESAGAAFGQLQPFIALLPGLSIAYSGLATTVGALIPELEGAAVAATALDLALGPVGLVAAGIAAAGALALFIAKTGDADDRMLDLGKSAGDLNQTLADLATSGFTTAQLEAIRGYEEAIQEMGRNSNATVPELKAVNDQITQIQAQLEGPYPLTIDPKDADAARAALERQLAALEATRDRYESAILSNEQYLQVQQDIEEIYAGANPLNFALVEQHLKDLTADMHAGGETADQYVQNVHDLKEQEDTYGLSLDQITQQTLDADAASNEYFNTLGRGGKSLQVLGDQFTDMGEASLHAADGVKAIDTATKSYVNTLSGAGRGEQVLGQQFTEMDVGGINAANSALADTARRANEADAALRKQMGAYYGLADGVTTAKDAQAAFKATQDGIIAAQEPYTHQLSEYQTQLGYINDAVDLLNQRQAEGIPLTKEQTQFLNDAGDAQARLQGGTEDATIALGLQAEQYAENMKIGDEMNQKLGDQTGATETLTATLNNLIAALQGIPGYVSSTVNVDTTAATNNINYINRQLDELNGRTSYATVVIQSYYTGKGVGYTTGEALGGLIPSPREVKRAQHGAALTGWSWVGEAGPELIYAPGARVLPHTASVASTKGARATYSFPNATFNIAANDPTEFARKFDRQMAAYRYGDLR
jgi:hypothetical protein